MPYAMQYITCGKIIKKLMKKKKKKKRRVHFGSLSKMSNLLQHVFGVIIVVFKNIFYL